MQSKFNYLKMLWLWLLIFVFTSNSYGYSFKFSTKILVVFSPHNKIKDILIYKITHAKKNILLAAYNLTDIDIINALLKAVKKQIHVNILLDGKCHSNTKIIKIFNYFRKRNNIYLSLKRNFSYKIMHNKFIIIDDNFLETGSYNYTLSAQKYNAENAIFLNFAPKIVNKYKLEFSNIWNKSI